MSGCMLSSAIPLNDFVGGTGQAVPSDDIRPFADLGLLVVDRVHRLIHDFPACGVGLWQPSLAGGMEPIAHVGVWDPSHGDLLADLTAQTLERVQTTSRLLTGHRDTLLLAAVVPGLADLVMSLRVPLTNSPAPEHDSRREVQQRSYDIELAAAQFATEHLRQRVLQLEEALAATPDTLPTAQPNAPQVPTTTKAALASSGQPPEAALTADQPLTWAGIRRAVRQTLSTWFQRYRGHPQAYLLIACGLILIGIMPIPHTVRCSVKCEPATRRFIAAPFEARLLKTSVEVGQFVEAGQVLATLDGGDLRSQLAGLKAKLAQATQRRSAAMTERDASKSEMERLEVQQLHREVELLESHQQELQVRSPIAGLVISGDLQHVEGVPLKVGETLFEIAPLESLVAEIAIPETDISQVRIGMPVSIALDAARGKYHRSSVKLIHLRSETINQTSVFVATAELENLNALLRPGMNGVAKIHVGLRTVGWIWLHKPHEALRQRLGW